MTERKDNYRCFFREDDKTILCRKIRDALITFKSRHGNKEQYYFTAGALYMQITQALDWNTRFESNMICIEDNVLNVVRRWKSSNRNCVETMIKNVIKTWKRERSRFIRKNPNW